MLYKDIYEKVLNHIKKGESIFITGPAGSGKTFLLKEVYDHLKKNNKRVVLTSTTGTNAMNLGGMTIHKLMGIGTQSNKNYINYMKHTFLFSGIKKRLAKIDIIIIDEVSMLRADTFELINVVLQEVSANKLPFGGKTLIFTGDFYQIPPVVKSFEKEQNQ
jgi:nucleoside-triphosphatase THEP1